MNSPVSLSLVYSVMRTAILAVSSTTLASRRALDFTDVGEDQASPLALMWPRVV